MPKHPIFNAAYALDRAAFAHPDRLSLTFGTQQWTVAQAAEHTRRLAQLLAHTGVSEGDRVVVISHNSPYHLLVHVACARLGALFVPVSYRLTQVELQRIIDFTAPRVVIAEPEIAARGAFASTGTLIHLLIDDDVLAGPLAEGTQHGYLALSSAASGFDSSLVADSPSSGRDELGGREYPEGPAAILFTSGSSGTPKAVELTHENLWWGSRNFREGFEYRNDECVLAVAPFSHIGGFNGTTLDLFSHGGHVVVMRSFEPGAVLEAIEEHGVNIMFAVPTMYRALVNHSEFATRDLSSWRLPLIGGSQVPADLLFALAERGLRPLNVWGMTEISASGCYLPFEHMSHFPGSIGRPFAYLEARVVDPVTCEDCEIGTSGELWVRGPSVTAGFWHGEEYTASAFHEGWLRTGDVVVENHAGCLSVVGRLSDLIMTGGEGVFPGEIEDVLREFPGVREAVVCGVPDQTWGERIVAALQMERLSELPTLEEVQSFAGSVLARYKLPRNVVFLEELPVNSSGKIDRRAIASLLWSRLSEAQPLHDEGGVA